MNENQLINYERVAQAIEYIQDNFKQQPDLDELASELNMSPFHFQRIFTEWAGVSPKKFLQYTSLEYAKLLLREKEETLFNTSIETGLSSTSRLHDLFINIEGMTPAEYKNEGEYLNINYNFYQSTFGNILIASTEKGICKISFFENELEAIVELKQLFSKANYTHKEDIKHTKVLGIFKNDWNDIHEIKLHLKGTEFQLKVWEALLKIPFAQLSTYSTIANEIKHSKASRAVGTAVGSNPIAYLIPCHRVIQSSGKIGGYMWGNTRKKAILAWEASRNNI